MIGYLKGNLIENDGGTLLLEVNGVGYEIICSKQAEACLIKNNGGGVYTYLAVKEDGVSLYGFSDKREKNMFLKLISVSGIGPKMGITILSGMDIESLAVMIASSDVKGLSSVKGLGKKTAERIILELREKVQASEDGATVQNKAEETKVDGDAVIALMSLGFTKGESEKVLSEAVNSGAKTLQELISYALKHIR